MFKDKLKNLKNIIIKKTDENSKKNIENLVVFLVLLIITVFAINIIWGEDKKEIKEQNVNTSYKKLAENLDNSNNKELEEYNLEDELEDILSKIIKRIRFIEGDFIWMKN